MKVIFLDIDGVLNSKNFYKNSGYAYSHPDDFLDPYAIQKLNKIIDKTDARVVVSSSWRIGKTVEMLSDILTKHGFQGIILDKTPNFISTELDRGDEIQNWLDNHPEIDSFIVIDDFNYPHFEQLFSARFIQTDYRVGITDDDARLCILTLNFPSSGGIE